MGEQRRRTTAWAMCAAALVLLLASAGLAVAAWGTPPPDGAGAWSSRIVGAVGFAGAPILGVVLASHPHSLRYGWWWCLLGLGFGVSEFAGSFVAYATGQGHAVRSIPLAATAGDLGWIAAVAAIAPLLLYFPDGTLPSPRWRVVAIVLRGAALAALVGTLLLPGAAATAPVDRAVVTSAVPRIGAALAVGGVFVVLSCIPAAAASLVVRSRRASAQQRTQIRWVVYAAVLLGVSVAVLTWWDAPGLWDAVLEMVPLVALYVAVGIAVRRHRLYDIDLLVNRTLVYGALTAAVVAAYVGLVGVLSAVFATRVSLPITLAATAVIAVVFQPLRERVQRTVNRLLYGERDDPFAVVTRLARALEAAVPTGEVLTTVVTTTAEALKLPHASVWQREDGRLCLAAVHGAAPATATVPEAGDLAAHLEVGRPVDIDELEPGDVLAAALEPTGATLAYPLHHRGDAVGLLCVAARSPGDSWGGVDRATLADLARHVGAAVHAARLDGQLRDSHTALQRSREQLVATQERERRRIQRDLHDGLGPTLAAVRLHVEGSLTDGGGTPPSVRRRLERIDELIGRATADVRRLVIGLHPPALTHQGVVAAIRTHVEQFGDDTGLTARFSGDGDVRLGPAVEVALFRVAQEALTNVAKHADASDVEVALTLSDGWARLVVTDDGVGMPTVTTAGGSGEGTGIAGMRERADLLGGRLTLGHAAGTGTQVTFEIPLEVSS